MPDQEGKLTEADVEVVFDGVVEEVRDRLRAIGFLPGTPLKALQGFAQAYATQSWVRQLLGYNAEGEPCLNDATATDLLGNLYSVDGLLQTAEELERERRRNETLSPFEQQVAATPYAVEDVRALKQFLLRHVTIQNLIDYTHFACPRLRTTDVYSHCDQNGPLGVFVEAVILGCIEVGALPSFIDSVSRNMPGRFSELPPEVVYRLRTLKR